VEVSTHELEQQISEPEQEPQPGTTQESPLHVLGAIHDATEPPQTPQASLTFPLLQIPSQPGLQAQTVVVNSPVPL
jgi:hypothetical protein